MLEESGEITLRCLETTAAARAENPRFQSEERRHETDAGGYGHGLHLRRFHSCSPNPVAGSDRLDR